MVSGPAAARSRAPASEHEPARTRALPSGAARTAGRNGRRQPQHAPPLREADLAARARCGAPAQARTQTSMVAEATVYTLAASAAQERAAGRPQSAYT